MKKVDAAKSYTMRLHLKLGDFPHDNIDLVKQACATNEPFCLIINTGDKDTRGEHWTALYHGSTSGGSKYVVYIDPSHTKRDVRPDQNLWTRLDL